MVIGRVAQNVQLDDFFEENDGSGESTPGDPQSVPSFDGVLYLVINLFYKTGT
jgi:hypothetical protein